MRLLVIDYSGHPFQVQLSRALAGAAHTVTHLYFRDFQTPHGNLQDRPDDRHTLTIRGLSLGVPFQKYSFLARRRQEVKFGRLAADEVAKIRPDAVLSANVPLDAQARIVSAAGRSGAAFVFWLQDLYGDAIDRVLRKKIGPLGAAIGAYYRALEMRLLRRSDGIVAITEDFSPLIVKNGVEPARVTVIENWAPLDEIPVYPRNNTWAVENGLAGKTNIVYAGTLGYKHDPVVLLELAKSLLDCSVTVFSGGMVADWLKAEALASRTENLIVRPWVPFADLPKMLAAADLVVAFVEEDAGVFSVPSKVLTYMAAGRPVLGAIPRSNLAARLIGREGAGVVVQPSDRLGFIRAAEAMVSSPEMRREMGSNGRRYAERAFDIAPILKRFETVLEQAIRRRHRRDWR